MSQLISLSVTRAVQSFFDMFEGKAVHLTLPSMSLGRPLDRAYELQTAELFAASNEVRLSFRKEVLTFVPDAYRYFFSVGERCVGIEIDSAGGEIQTDLHAPPIRMKAGTVSLFVMPSDYDRAPREQFDYDRWKAYFRDVVSDVSKMALAHE